MLLRMSLVILGGQSFPQNKLQTTKKKAVKMNNNKSKAVSNFKGYTVTVAIIWTIVVIASMAWNILITCFFLMRGGLGIHERNLG